MDEANVEGENMSVGSIVHGGYTMMEDHAKVRGTFVLNGVNVSKRVESERKRASTPPPVVPRVPRLRCGSKPLSRGRALPCD